MSADLKSNSVFDRLSFVITDDSLIKLEHASTRDRIRKFRFVEVEAILFSRAVPLLRIIICALCFVIPGIFILFVGETFTFICGLCLVALGFGLIVWYLTAGRTTIQIYRANKPTPEKFSGIFRPSRLRRFQENLIAGIQRTQAAVALRGDVPIPAAEPSATVVPAEPIEPPLDSTDPNDFPQ